MQVAFFLFLLVSPFKVKPYILPKFFFLAFFRITLILHTMVSLYMCMRRKNKTTVYCNVAAFCCAFFWLDISLLLAQYERLGRGYSQIQLWLRVSSVKLHFPHFIKKNKRNVVATLWQRYTNQWCMQFFKSEGAESNVLGII